jgi:biopolymer transport protein ExbD
MGASLTPARGSGRPLDAAINLVPFIDLLSCCLAFLLITAAWSQVARLDLSPAGSDGTVAAAPPLVLLVERAAYTLIAPGGATVTPVADGGEALAAALRAQRHGGDDALLVRVADGVDYARLVRALDLGRGAGFARLSVESSATDD